MYPTPVIVLLLYTHVYDCEVNNTAHSHVCVPLIYLNIYIYIYIYIIWTWKLAQVVTLTCIPEVPASNVRRYSTWSTPQGRGSCSTVLMTLTCIPEVPASNVRRYSTWSTPQGRGSCSTMLMYGTYFSFHTLFLCVVIKVFSINVAGGGA